MHVGGGRAHIEHSRDMGRHGDGRRQVGGNSEFVVMCACACACELDNAIGNRWQKMQGRVDTIQDGERPVCLVLPAVRAPCACQELEVTRHLMRISAGSETRSGLTLSQPCLTTSRLAEHTGACAAEDDSLCVREDGGDSEAPWITKHTNSPQALPTWVTRGKQTHLGT